MQLLYIFSSQNFFPQVIEHVLGRIPLDFSDLNPLLFLSIALLAFGEEIVFTGLIQDKIRIVNYTTEGAPMLHDLVSDGTAIHSTYDSTETGMGLAVLKKQAATGLQY